MENNYSHPENSVINLRQLPPIDPSRIVNPSFNRRWSKPKFGKPNFNRGLKPCKSDVAPRKSNSSASSSGKTSENHGNTTTSDSDSAENGMKQGSARSNLYEICAANHWKPLYLNAAKRKVLVIVENSPSRLCLRWKRD